MPVTAKAYGNMPLNALKKLISDLNSGDTTVKCMLTTVDYVPDQDVHENKGQVTNEVEGAEYIAGGKALTGKAVTYAARVTKFDADDVEWAASTITARRAVLYDDTPEADADKKLLIWVDFGENKSSEAGTFKIAWNEGGIFTITVAA